MVGTIIDKRPFGHTESGEAVDCYTLKNGEYTAEMLSYGGIIRSLTVPTSKGSRRDVVLGFDDIAGYERHNRYIGALVGRVSNRIGNARFLLNGTTYSLAANNGSHCLHGGNKSYHMRIWHSRVKDGVLTLSLISPDGDEGFPGALTLEVEYSLAEGNLSILYTAECDADTPVSLTNHSYFNLNGHSGGVIDNHAIQIFSDTITEPDSDLIPTGNTPDVTGTLFDLRQRKVIGQNTYDHNFILSAEPCTATQPVAVLMTDELCMTCLTTQPGLQFYTGDYLGNYSGKEGASYGRRSGLCLETQSWPDSVNHTHFPSCILRKGELYCHKTIYRFTSQKEGGSWCWRSIRKT